MLTAGLLALLGIGAVATALSTPEEEEEENDLGPDKWWDGIDQGESQSEVKTTYEPGSILPGTEIKVTTKIREPAVTSVYKETIRSGMEGDPSFAKILTDVKGDPLAEKLDDGPVNKRAIGTMSPHGGFTWDGTNWVAVKKTKKMTVPAKEVAKSEPESPGFRERVLMRETYATVDQPADFFIQMQDSWKQLTSHEQDLFSDWQGDMETPEWAQKIIAEEKEKEVAILRSATDKLRTEADRLAQAPAPNPMNYSERVKYSKDFYEYVSLYSLLVRRQSEDEDFIDSEDEDHLIDEIDHLIDEMETRYYKLTLAERSLLMTTWTRDTIPKWMTCSPHIGIGDIVKITGTCGVLICSCHNQLVVTEGPSGGYIKCKKPDGSTSGGYRLEDIYRYYPDHFWLPSEAPVVSIPAGVILAAPNAIAYNGLPPYTMVTITSTGAAGGGGISYATAT